MSASVGCRLPETAITVLGDYATELDDPEYQAAKSRLEIKARLRALRHLENVLAVGNWLYRSVRLIERQWRTDVLEGRILHDPGEDRSIRELYSQWSQTCLRCLAEIEEFRAGGFPIRGAREFEKHHAEAADILSGRVNPFENESQAWLWAARTANSRQEPRPMQVDRNGNLFEMTGQRFVMPGLEPEAILRGIADADAGRVRPLKEIISERQTHGV
jgi:hypothetical protein